jgi:hypothetical protein
LTIAVVIRRRFRRLAPPEDFTSLAARHYENKNGEFDDHTCHR